MAINKIQGNILADNLSRGSNLAFQTDLVYINVLDDRVGINTTATTHTLTINGNCNISTELFVDGNTNVANIYAGNVDVRPDGGIYANTGFFLGNVDVIGNLNATVGVIYANSGIFYGNAQTGIDAAFAGVPGFTPLGSNVIMQFAGNVNSYAQLNFENINNGTLASTDLVLTSNNGNDSTYFLDVGITGSNHTDPDFFGDIGSTNNEAYIYVVASDEAGPSSDNGPGNLIIGSTNGIIKMFVGNTAQANVITTITSDGMDVVGNLVTDFIQSTDGNITGNLDVTNLDAVNFTTTGNVTLGNFVFANNTMTLVSSGNITITPTSNGTAIIDSTAGLSVPVGNTAARPTGVSAGTIRFNTTLSSLEYYDGSVWASIDINFQITSQTITPDGITNTFTLDQSTSAEKIIVTINGVTQIPNTNYTVSGTTFVLMETPLSTDIIEIRFISPVPASGAVNPGTATQLGFYASTGASMSGTGANLTWNGANTLSVIGETISSILRLTPGAEPGSPQNGMIAVANGTSWNPGGDGLQHLMARLNNAWVQLD